MILGYVLGPILCCFIIARDILLRRALENCHIKVFRIQFQHVYKIFPGHINGSFLEIVAKTPVTQHFKHRVMVGVMTYFLQIVVLT